MPSEKQVVTPAEAGVQAWEELWILVLRLCSGHAFTGMTRKARKPWPWASLEISCDLTSQNFLALQAQPHQLRCLAC